MVLYIILGGGIGWHAVLVLFVFEDQFDELDCCDLVFYAFPVIFMA